MQTKTNVHNLIILDESGSMEIIKKHILKALEDITKNIKNIAQENSSQQQYLSLHTFNSSSINIHYNNSPIHETAALKHHRYQPYNGTPLYDAIGHGIYELQKQINPSAPYKVLVTILTDGLENDSKTYTKSHIKTLIQRLEQHHWTFTYIGTDHDVSQVSKSLAIKHNLRFSKNQRGIEKMIAKDQEARHKFAKILKQKHSDEINNFFE